MSKDISANSARVARNTVLLYFRMLLLMFIGLFTARVVLQALGKDDYGVYGVVGGIVTMFTVVTASLSQAISRYITYELGKGDGQKLRRIFATSVVVQLIFCAVVLVLTETLGLWWLNCRMDIPDGRLGAANWVLQCSMGVLMVNLLSVPFNATIIAHEKMGAYAGISILEAALKLAVAILLSISGADKLKLYAVLMLAVAVIVRLAYGTFCHRHFEESRGKLVYDRKLVSEMTSFAGWNCLGSGAYIINTQGVNQMVNVFFGVGANAARLVTSQVENIVKQFVSNFLTALNPQVTKSYASGDMRYCHELVSKGTKFSFLVILFFALPLMYEAPALLDLWLDEVPENSALFVRLMLLGLMADMACNPLLTLIQSTGRVKRYYIVSSLTAISAFAVSLIAFRLGAGAEFPYAAFALVYFMVDIEKLIFAKAQTAFPLRSFLRDAVLPCMYVTLAGVALSLPLWLFLPEGPGRSITVTAVSVLAVCVFSWLFALTPGERDFFVKRLRHAQR